MSTDTGSFLVLWLDRQAFVELPLFLPTRISQITMHEAKEITGLSCPTRPSQYVSSPLWVNPSFLEEQGQITLQFQFLSVLNVTKDVKSFSDGCVQQMP